MSVNENDFLTINTEKGNAFWEIVWESSSLTSDIIYQHDKIDSFPFLIRLNYAKHTDNEYPPFV